MSDWRDLYLIPQGGPYLLTHSVGCQPRATRAALEQHVLHPWAQRGGEAWSDWLDAIDRFRRAAAKLIGADMAAVCPRDSVSSALFTILAGLPKIPGRNVLLASKHAFPTIGFVMGALDRLGLHLRLIDGAMDPTDPETWRREISDDVAAIVMMHVHSNSGAASPVEEIAAIARARGVWSIVDAAQSVGILPIDVTTWGADAVIASCVKWLSGGPGAAFLWVRPDRIDALRPIDVGWFSHADPFAFDIADFRYADDARRFWGGTPSILPFVIGACGIETVLGIGVERMQAHNRHLIGIASASAGASWPMEERGGTLCLRFADIAAAERGLQAIDCRYDRRGETLRVSFHAMNDEREAEMVGHALRNTGAQISGTIELRR